MNLLFRRFFCNRILLTLLCVLSRPALAQLNENCTVSILNRTAQVDQNGNWQIIHQARSGEAKNWWAFTAIRKARQAGGHFPFK